MGWFDNISNEIKSIIFIIIVNLQNLTFVRLHVRKWESSHNLIYLVAY